jgi:hypothetical protein
VVENGIDVWAEKQRGGKERKGAIPTVRLNDNAGAHQAVAAHLNIAMTPLVRCSLGA